uniref:Tetrahydrofolate dehydrogenase/cyclohydrolase NAD(P)-binding domain-containing protein n=1 Tax=Equus asinus TaxID=9793 RepID=A0A9L0J8F2_EQUAS
MNEETRAGVGWPSVTPAESGRGLPSSANHGMLPRLPSPPGPRSWLFLLQSQTGLYWATANGCRREAGPTTRPRYNGAARARASLPARTPARGMAAASFVSTLAAWLLRPAQSCRLRHSPFHLSAVRNEAVVISGRKLAQQIKQEVRQEVEEWVASGNKRPHLSVVLIGENPASHSYVLNKTRAAADVGDATVTISHRYTPKEQLKKHTILADIVVSAAGIPNLITADMIKEGATVIDVGINRIQDPITAKPKLVGDVDFEEVRKKAGYITPVPGGVGPMTVAMLMKNTVIAAKKVLRPEEREVLKSKELGVATN